MRGFATSSIPSHRECPHAVPLIYLLRSCSLIVCHTPAVPEVMQKLTAKEELVLSPHETAVAMRTESVDHLYARENEKGTCFQVAISSSRGSTHLPRLLPRLLSSIPPTKSMVSAHSVFVPTAPCFPLF